MKPTKNIVIIPIIYALGTIAGSIDNLFATFVLGLLTGIFTGFVYPMFEDTHEAR